MPSNTKHESSPQATWRPVSTLRRAANVVLLLVIFSALVVLYGPSHGANDANTASDAVLVSNRRLAALSKARELDHKYLPGLVSQTNSGSSLQLWPDDSGVGPSIANYSTTIVLGRLRDEPERVLWVDELLNMHDKQIYIVDDAKSELPHLAKNHGREAAVYLTYIVDHYDKLNDITFFWHTDRTVWHNNLLMKWDSVQTINRMDRGNIMRQGYVPSRCDHWPGCPDWIKFNPSKAEHRLDPHRLEDMFTPDIFNEIFPEAKGEFPPYFAGTCCSQFAVSRDTIRSRPVEMYKRLLRWITEYESDDRSGMVLEYTWPYIFLGRGSLCPSMYDCYCRTYNFCIEDQRDLRQLENWNALRTRREEIKWQVVLTNDTMNAKAEQMKKEGKSQRQIAAVVDSLMPELERLNDTLNHLVDITWSAREEIVKHWKLPAPPVGW